MIGEWIEDQNIENLNIDDENFKKNCKLIECKDKLKQSLWNIVTEVDKLVYNDEFAQITIDLKHEYKQIMNDWN